MSDPPFAVMEKCQCFSLHSLYLCLSIRISALLRGTGIVLVNSLGISFSLFRVVSVAEPVVLVPPPEQFQLQPSLPLTHTEMRFWDGFGGAFRFSEMVSVVEPVGPNA